MTGADGTEGPDSKKVAPRAPIKTSAITATVSSRFQATRSATIAVGRAGAAEDPPQGWRRRSEGPICKVTQNAAGSGRQAHPGIDG